MVKAFLIYTSRSLCEGRTNDAGAHKAERHLAFCLKMDTKIGDGARKSSRANELARRQSDPDTMTITALESFVSLSGKNYSGIFLGDVNHKHNDAFDECAA